VRIVSEQRSPLEQTLDLVLYAPVGLAAAARDELPSLVERGRGLVSSQAAIAKVVGRFAVTTGQREAAKVAKHAAKVLVDLGVLPAVPPAPAPRRPARLAGAEAAATAEAEPARLDAHGSVPSAAPADADDLAIPGYGALSASQVVQRLAGLSGTELEAVRDYELGTRGRRTILNKIAQLQAEGT